MEKLAGEEGVKVSAESELFLLKKNLGEFNSVTERAADIRRFIILEDLEGGWVGGYVEVGWVWGSL